MELKQLSIFVENKKGRLEEITGILAKHQITIRAVSIADTTDYGILRLIVNKPDEAMVALKENGITVSITSVIAIAIDDKPGALYEAVKLLSDNDISIEYMYSAFPCPKLWSSSAFLDATLLPINVISDAIISPAELNASATIAILPETKPMIALMISKNILKIIPNILAFLTANFFFIFSPFVSIL